MKHEMPSEGIQKKRKPKFKPSLMYRLESVNLEPLVVVSLKGKWMHHFLSVYLVPFISSEFPSTHHLMEDNDAHQDLLVNFPT